MWCFTLSFLHCTSTCACVCVSMRQTHPVCGYSIHNVIAYIFDYPRSLDMLIQLLKIRTRVEEEDKNPAVVEAIENVIAKTAEDHHRGK